MKFWILIYDFVFIDTRLQNVCDPWSHSDMCSSSDTLRFCIRVVAGYMLLSNGYQTSGQTILNVKLNVAAA